MFPFTMPSVGLLDKFPLFLVTCIILLTNESSVTSQHSVKQPPHKLEPSSDLQRQNQITQQILTQYLQRRLFPHNHSPLPNAIPNITDRELDEELETRGSETVGNFYSRGTRSESPESDGGGGGGGECSNCIDDSTGSSMSRWSMPLVKSGEKRYYLNIFFKANWYRATQYCRYHGMHLASIASQEENDRLEKHIRDFGLGHEHFWMSGTDQAEEGTFFWMATGRPITFTNWNAGEPNNFRYENGEEEHCLELWNRDGKGMKWNDSPCSFETYFVCEL
uniref:Brevican core protein n=1 Tax=Cacopsylla melanoneura TaxID=428564 RepID=A0A8D8YIB8_9HEMI